MKQINPESLSFNPFTKIRDEWMLVTAGDETAHNTMTANWGGLGVLWSRNVATCYIRPQRHTFGFMEKSGGYSLCFFDESYRDALKLCGSRSGRDIDKDKATGLTCDFYDGIPYYKEASLVLICRKLFSQKFAEDSFDAPEVFRQIYPANDLHTMYIGEIVAALAKD